MSVSLLQDSKTGEADLVARIAAGDKNAEREFVLRYQQGIRVIVRRHCRAGDGAAEDLAQDVLLRVLERLRARRDCARFADGATGGEIPKDVEGEGASMALGRSWRAAFPHRGPCWRPARR